MLQNTQLYMAECEETFIIVPQPHIPRARYDSPWKDILEHFLQAFMELCLSTAAVNIDWSRGYVPLDKELNKIIRQQAIGNRVADKLFKLWLKSGNEVWLLLHVEVQAKKENDFEERMYIYNYRLFDRYRKPILSAAILADDHPHWRPNYYERVSWYNKVYFEFAMIKLLDYEQSEEKLTQSSNPFAIVIWAHLQALKTRKQPDLRLQSKLTITRALYKQGFKKDYIILLLNFIDWVLALPEPLELEYTQQIEQLEKEKPMARYIHSAERLGMKRGWEKGWKNGLLAGQERGLEQGIEKGIEQGIERGIEQGIEQGIEKGERTILTRLLECRFGPLSADYQAQLNTTDSNQLLLWSERLLEAKTLADIFEN